MHEYDLIADWYLKTRSPGIGVAEVKALARALPPGARVLDIGCGTGIPVTGALLTAGCRVVALDSSRAMLARFRMSHPHVPALQAAIESCPLREQAFDAAVAWGVVFHLDHERQGRAFASVATVLKPEAPFLFTAGDRDGSTDGEMHGVRFRYFSFTVDGYRELLREHGLFLVEHHVDADGNSHYLARKAP